MKGLLGSILELMENIVDLLVSTVDWMVYIAG